MPIDLRTQKLAKLAVNYSVEVKPGENVVITGGTEAEDFMLALYKEVILAGAHPIVRMGIKESAPFFYKHAKKYQIEKMPEVYEYTAKIADKFITINTDANTKELSAVDPKKMTARQKVIKPIRDVIMDKKWVLVTYPISALAQDAEMSLNDYESFVYGASLQNWEKLSRLFNKIKSKFKKNSKIHLIGKNVDLKFKVHGDKAVICDGKMNMPGGEIFMAPIRESLNGKIKFEYPDNHYGKEIRDIELEFEDGKVISAKASKNEDLLKEALATDKGSCYVGEFGIGCNPKITKFTGELGLNEKIGGTIHLALGEAYKENGGGNESAIHWDIVKDMSQSKLIVDGKVIQENGKWKL
jgi:aminopeptidase